MHTLKRVLSSPRFYATFVAVAFVFVEAYAPDFPLTEKEVTEIIVALSAYILGTSIRAHS